MRLVMAEDLMNLLTNHAQDVEDVAGGSALFGTDLRFVV